MRRLATTTPCLLLLLSLGCPSEQVVVRETEASCGNGELEEGEQCDDGNVEQTDGCTGACALAACGDGVLRLDLDPGG